MSAEDKRAARHIRGWLTYAFAWFVVQTLKTLDPTPETKT